MKRIALLALALGAVISTAYADTKISALPSAAAQTGTEVLPEYQTGQCASTGGTCGVLLSQIKTYTNASVPAANLTGQVGVPAGGTGLGTFTAHGVLLGEGTSNFSVTAALGLDTLLQGQGTSADPAAVSVPNCGSSSQALAYSTSTHTFSCQTITVLATPVTVANGGTGLGTLPAHGVLVGEGTSNVANVAAMAADTVLQGQGASADPAAIAVNNCGSNSTALSYSTSTHTFGCQTITGAVTPAGSTGNVQWNNAGSFAGVTNGSSGQALLSNGASAPSWGSAAVIGTTQSSANSNFPFVGANGTQLVWGAGVTFNPSTNTLSATTFSGNATNATLAATLTTASSSTAAQFPPVLANGTSMIWDGSVLINPSTHDVSATTHTGADMLTLTTVAGLPTCNAGNKGRLQAVTDANGPTYNATVAGSGAVSIPVYCNGSNWTAH